jgi:hypothetical protein
MTRLIVAKLTYRYSFKMVNTDFVWEKDALSCIMWAGYRLIAKVRREENDEAPKTSRPPSSAESGHTDLSQISRTEARSLSSSN